MNCNEQKQWQIAMDSEMKSLKKNNTWQIVDRPKDKEVIDVKWVYKRKNKNLYKARLVVRGFQQQEYIENVYSPVGRMQTLKILLSYSCKNNLFIEQMDVETACLNGYVKTEVYINEPEGYETGDNKVCKLQKALYGLRESPRAWYDCFNKFIDQLNFVRSNYDYCLYVNNASKDSIYIYTNLCGRSLNLLQRQKQNIQSESQFNGKIFDERSRSNQTLYRYRYTL